MTTVAHLTPSFKALPLPISQLSLAAVLQCGQSFRWSIFPLPPGITGDLPNYEYRLCLHDRVVCLRQTSDTLFYRSVLSSLPLSASEEEIKEAETLTWIQDYFQLDVDLEQLYRQWSSRDRVFEGLQGRFRGIRILRQDPFECLLSFICSSNNNIARITKMVKALCQQFSPPLLKLPPPHVQSDDERITTTYHPFPRPSVLAAPEVSSVLRSLGFGYRAAFIQRTAKMLVDAQGISTLSTVSLEPAELWLRTLRKMNTAEARVELLKFVGVGRKVADCVLLMSLDKTEVVPVDTHVHQIASKHYGLPSSKAKANMTPALYEQVNAKFTEVWGTYAGWAHSVLFTSDLKAFSTYGLHSDASSTILPSPSPSPTKRKRKEDRPTKDTTSATPLKVSTLLLREDLPEAGLSLADRVKRRRRGQDTSSSIT